MNKEEFLKSLEELGIAITKHQSLQLEKYYNLLIEYNKITNLTRIVEKDEVYLKHFYDSLTIIKMGNFETINSICDMGTGAGFPGMVIKILFPEKYIALVDSLNKRVQFLETVKNELKLEKIDIYHERIEEFSKKNEEKFDMTVSRAVTNISNIIEMSMKAVKRDGYIVLMKGNISRENINQKKIEEKFKLKFLKNINFQLPFEAGERTLFVIKKIKKTPNIFPRKYNLIKKDPI